MLRQKRNGRRIQAKQFIFETEFAFTTAEPHRVTKTVHHSPEQIFEQFCRSMLVGIRQGRFIGSLTDSQMSEFALATSQTTADFPQGIGMYHMAEKHGHQLRPTGEAFGPPFCLMLCYDRSIFCPGKVMEQLTKQTRYPYHDRALFGNCDGKFVGAKILHHNSPRELFYNPILDKSGGLK